MQNRLPRWFKQEIPDIKVTKDISTILAAHSLHTVCQSASCPNQNNCFKERCATFLILGDVCTRNCGFCAVKKGKALPIDSDTPGRIAKIVKAWDLDYVVITSVTRDDLIDGGAGQFALTIKEIRKVLAQAKIEVLIPDFKGSARALELIMTASPDVISHNLETVPRLYKEVRPQADYRRSLELLARIKRRNPKIIAKSGIMLGLGEKFCESLEVMRDLKRANCDILTLGQYLRPNPACLEVKSFIAPEAFAIYKDIANAFGFKSVASAPLVRSSYKAKELFSFA